MKKMFVSLFCLVLAAFLSSCTVFQGFSGTEKKPEPVQTKTIDKYPGAVMLKALVKDEAKSFLKFLPREVREEYGVNGFRNTRNSMMRDYGKIISYTYIADLRHPKYKISVWKVHFQRKSSDNKRSIDQETLFRTITYIDEDKETLIDWRFL